MSKRKIKLTIRQHNKLFRYRQVKFLTYYEIIDDPQKRDIEMRQYIRLPVRVISILLSPLAILVGGVPAMITLIKECLVKTKVGADTINREWFYEQLRGNNDQHLTR
ncbi:hypothetical protein [Acinetobacter sp. YH12066]|uniref:hypothetical protein n=1 Tax=Acinetobacter sp. YH12066 TaxID=2601063 RepID=UPI0015D30EDA|nr:hypothetical protein [Acinetobacter sp. YH12066]